MQILTPGIIKMRNYGDQEFTSLNVVMNEDLSTTVEDAVNTINTAKSNLENSLQQIQDIKNFINQYNLLTGPKDQLYHEPYYISQNDSTITRISSSNIDVCVLAINIKPNTTYIIKKYIDSTMRIGFSSDNSFGVGVKINQLTVVNPSQSKQISITSDTDDKLLLIQPYIATDTLTQKDKNKIKETLIIYEDVRADIQKDLKDIDLNNFSTVVEKSRRREQNIVNYEYTPVKDFRIHSYYRSLAGLPTEGGNTVAKLIKIPITKNDNF